MFKHSFEGMSVRSVFLAVSMALLSIAIVSVLSGCGGQANAAEPMDAHLPMPSAAISAIGQDVDVFLEAQAQAQSEADQDQAGTFPQKGIGCTFNADCPYKDSCPNFALHNTDSSDTSAVPYCTYDGNCPYGDSCPNYSMHHGGGYGSINNAPNGYGYGQGYGCGKGYGAHHSARHCR